MLSITAAKLPDTLKVTKTIKIGNSSIRIVGNKTVAYDIVEALDLCRALAFKLHYNSPFTESKDNNENKLMLELRGVIDRFDYKIRKMTDFPCFNKKGYIAFIDNSSVNVDMIKSCCTFLTKVQKSNKIKDYENAFNKVEQVYRNVVCDLYDKLEKVKKIF